MNEDISDLQSILDDMRECGGPRLWHLEELIKMVIHMRRLIEENAR